MDVIYVLTLRPCEIGSNLPNYAIKTHYKLCISVEDTVIITVVRHNVKYKEIQHNCHNLHFNNFHGRNIQTCTLCCRLAFFAEYPMVLPSTGRKFFDHINKHMYLFFKLRNHSEIR